MSGEAAIVEAVARVAIAVLGPVIEEALRGGEPEEERASALRLADHLRRTLRAEDETRETR